jgi:hypothetical protein
MEPSVEVDDPLGLDPGDKIVTLRSLLNDPLARLHSRRQIDEAQYQGGRSFQNDWEKAERGPQAVDPSREYVDGGQFREPITESQRKAVLRLNRIARELGADGSALVHEALILGMIMEIGERRGLGGQRWMDYFCEAASRMSGPAGAGLWICDGEAGKAGVTNRPVARIAAGDASAAGEAGMKLRLGFSVALVVVLYGIWLLASKPSCLGGYKASLASATAWACVSE